MRRREERRSSATGRYFSSMLEASSYMRERSGVSSLPKMR